MGCASSNGVVCKRPVISERDAFDVALAWSEQLRGCVRVELEPSEEELPLSIVPVFEWIVIVFNGTKREAFRHVDDPKRTAAYARAATITWFALSCCEGYSGRENPIFWSRVLSTLLYPPDLHLSRYSAYTYPIRPQRPMSEAVRFFSHPDRPFPRIKLAVGSDSNDDSAAIESVFLGRQLHDDKERDTRLHRIMTKLQPFIRSSHWMRRVPVEIELMTPPKTKPAVDVHSIPKNGEIASMARISAASSVDFPQFHLQSMTILDTHTVPMHDLHSLTPSSDMEVRLRGHLPSFVHDHRLSRGLLNQLQGDCTEKHHYNWRVSQLRVVQDCDLSYSYLSILCSALPHLQSISTVTLPRDRYPQGNAVSATSDWAWLGYAIFHPDATTMSAFTSFVVDLDRVTAFDVAAFARMAVGNNLLGGENAFYLEGRVQSSAKVMKNPVNSDEPSVYTFDHEAWVGLCVAALETVEHEDWVFVVVRGFGLGWIRRNSIIATRERRPGKSCIRALRVNGHSKAADETALTVLLGVLDLLGGGITSLYLQDNSHISIPAVQSILRRCPSLKSLRIYHNGSFWADETLVMHLPRLEELELTMQCPNAASQLLQDLKPACLPYLRALRVISSEKSDWLKYRHTLVSFLQNQPVAQYFDWSCGFDMRTWVDVLSLRKNQATYIFLEGIPFEQHFSQGPLSVDCRVAFLSVIDQTSDQTGKGKLGQDVVALIFQYVTSASRREIFINLDYTNARS